MKEVERPWFYRAGGLEVIDVIEAFGLTYGVGTAVQHLLRADKKGDAIDDLRKARWYLDREIAKRERDLIPRPEDFAPSPSCQLIRPERDRAGKVVDAYNDFIRTLPDIDPRTVKDPMLQRMLRALIPTNDDMRDYEGWASRGGPFPPRSSNDVDDSEGDRKIRFVTPEEFERERAQAQGKEPDDEQDE
jgi:hypothetical protein